MKANPDLDLLAVDSHAQIVSKDADITQFGKLFRLGRPQYI